MKLYPILFLFLFSISTGYTQGKIDGFYRGSGNVSAVLGLGYEDTPKYFIGKERSDIERSLYYASIFGAYGITDRLDINISLPFFLIDDVFQVQDVSFYMKYLPYKFQFEKSKLELSAALGFSTPASDYKIGRVNDIGQQATLVEPRVMLHYQANSGWFMTLQSGYAFKSEEVPDSMPVTFKVGRALSNWYYDVWYDYQNSFEGIDYLGTPRPQNFKELGVDYHKAGGTVYRPLGSDFGVYASFSYVISGRNVFQGPAYGIGLVYDFSVK